MVLELKKLKKLKKKNQNVFKIILIHLLKYEKKIKVQ